MKFMILVKSNPDIEARLATMSESQIQHQMSEMQLFNNELKNAGVLKDCAGLRPSSEGKRVRFNASRGLPSTGRSRGISLPAIGFGSCPPPNRLLPGSSGVRIPCRCRPRSKSDLSDPSGSPRPQRPVVLVFVRR